MKYCNRDTGRERAEVFALVGADDRTAQLCDLGSIAAVVENSHDLLGRIDALVVTNRDGASHRAEAEPFLRAGTPVWVDKPLATTAEDADAMIGAAVAGQTQLTSYSPLRWIDDTAELAAEASQLGRVQVLTITGPADPASEHSGIFFYGIHCADVAQRLAPGETEDLEVQMSADTVLIRYRSDGVAVTLQLVKPDQGRQVPFHATVVGRHGIAARQLTLGPRYVEPGIVAFLDLLDSHALPVPYVEMRRPVEILERVRVALG